MFFKFLKNSWQCEDLLLLSKVSHKEEKDVRGLIIVKQILLCICQSCIYASEGMLAVTCPAWRADQSVSGLHFGLSASLSLPLEGREGNYLCASCPDVQSRHALLPSKCSWVLELGKRHWVS